MVFVNLNYINTAKCVICLSIVCLITSMIGIACIVPEAIRNLTYSETCLPNGGETLQCDRTETNVYSFISGVLERKYNEIKEEKEVERRAYFGSFGGVVQALSVNTGISSAMKPAAKLVGTKCLPKNETEMTPIDNWCTGRELSNRGGFLRHGVRYYKGRLVVPVSGSYWVYSFLECYEPCIDGNGKPDIQNETTPIKHAIYRYSVTDDKNVELVASVQPHEIAKNEYENVYGSHISTVVELQSGDEVSVQVSNVTLLKNPRDNYFGLILIK